MVVDLTKYVICIPNARNPTEVLEFTTKNRFEFAEELLAASGVKFASITYSKPIFNTLNFKDGPHA